jgi:hypothetical protein
LLIEQDPSCGDPVKTEYDQDQGLALVGQMRKPLNFAPRSFADGSEILSGYFLWDRPVNGSAKSRKN